MIAYCIQLCRKLRSLMREALSTFLPFLMISHKALRDLLQSPHITGMLKTPTSIRRPLFGLSGLFFGVEYN